LAAKETLFILLGMIQQIIVIAAFIAAVLYAGRMVYRNFTVKEGCGTGCGKCSAVDFADIEKQIKEKTL
jgi:hypothetical protein